MELYGGLFESMLSCCGRTRLRNGPLYTVSMMALTVALSLNMLSVIDLLWVLGLLENPYLNHGSLHPSRVLCALLCLVFVANAALARRQLSVVPHAQHWPRDCHTNAPARMVAPIYLFVSAALFLITLGFSLNINT